MHEKIIGMHFHHKGTFFVYESGKIHVERRGEFSLHELPLPFKRATNCHFTTVENLHSRPMLIL